MRYFYHLFTLTIALAGLSILAAMTTDITVALLNDTSPVWTTGWGYIGVIIGTASAIASTIDTSRRD